MPTLQPLQQAGDEQHRQRDPPEPDPWLEPEDQQAPEQHVEDATQELLTQAAAGPA